MFDDDTVTFQLAVMLRTMDIALSVDHQAKLEEEGYFLFHVDEAVVEGLITQQDELRDELNSCSAALVETQFDVQNQQGYIAELVSDYENFTDRLVEFTS